MDKMTVRGLLLIFAIGCIILFAAFAIGWANWAELPDRTGIMQVLMGSIGVIALFLATMTILNSGKTRWTALTLCAILLLGFSALLIFSVGWLIAPAALVILVFSISKLKTNQSQAKTH